MEDLRPEARAAGVDRTVLVQTITVPEETPEFLALAAEQELIAGVVGWTDLTRPDIADELAGLRELPGGEYLKGIRHQVQGEPDPEWLLRPDVRRGLAAVAAAGPGVRPGRPPAPAARVRQGGRVAAATHLRPRPLGQAAGRRRRSRTLGDRRPRSRRPAQHGLQALRPGHRGGPRLLDDRRPAPVRGHGPGRLRSRPADVRLRLAGVHARRVVRPSAVPGRGVDRLPRHGANASRSSPAPRPASTASDPTRRAVSAA